MNVGISMLIDIEKLFVKYRPPVKTVIVYRAEPYYKTEQEMIIQDYNGSDLTGWELEVFNSKV
jgi:hypothetical protein